MKPFLYHFFHRETNDRLEKGMVNIPSDSNSWPESWKKVDYKEYPLHPHFNLEKQTGEFKKLLQKRKTTRKISKIGMTKNQLAYLLECSSGLREGSDEKRNAPSGGGRYPIETYLFLFKSVENIIPGIYHYSVKNHALELIVERKFSSEEIATFSSYDWLIKATGIICFSAVFGRSIEKYGSRGYRYILLETGHMAQNLLLAAAELSVDMIPIGGFNEHLVEPLFGLNGTREKIVYALYLQ